MRELIKKITPPFIKRFDQFLLVNFPTIWASRLHYVIFFGGLILLFNMSLSLFQQISFQNVPNSIWILWYSFIVGLIITVVWISTQTLINYRINHGRTNRLHDLSIAALFFLVLMLISVSIIIPWWTLNTRIATTLLEPALPSLKWSSGTGNNLTSTLEYFDHPELNFLAGLRSYSDSSKQYMQYGFDSSSFQYSIRDSLIIERFSGHESEKLMVYFPNKYDKIESKIIKTSIMVSIFLVKNLSTGQQEEVKAYSFVNPNTRIMEYFNADDIHYHLIKDFKYGNLSDKNYLDYNINRNMKNLIQASSFSFSDKAIWIIIIFSNVLICYFTQIITNIIKFYGIRSFLLGLIIPIVSVPVLLGLIAIFFPRIHERDAFTFLTFFIGIVLFTFFIITFSFKRHKRINVQIVQWLFYFVPIFLVMLVFINENFFNIDIPIGFVAYALVIFYFTFVPLYTSRLYHLYSLPKV